MKHGSLFTGIGGFDLACTRAGIETAWQVEIDRRCQTVLAHHWPEVRRYDDVRQCGRANLEPVDIITGGFPCQDVSIAGRRAGLAGERSGLWLEFRRILAELRPQWVVVENVPGLLSSNRGRDFAVVLQGLAELGYLSAWRVLDAQHFGVPQRRRRVFIVGHLGDGRAAEVLFEHESLRRDTPPGRKAGQDVAFALASSVRGSGDGHGNGWNSTYIYGGNNTGGPIDVATALIARATNRLDFESETFIVNAFNGYTGGADDNDAQAGHVVAFDLAQITSRCNRTRVETGLPASTLNQKGQMYCAMRQAVRRLTPTECERLQGFLDGWTATGLSDASRYRMLGNAVAVPVVEWLMKRIAEEIITVQNLQASMDLSPNNV